MAAASPASTATISTARAMRRRARAVPPAESTPMAMSTTATAVATTAARLAPTSKAAQQMVAARPMPMRMRLPWPDCAPCSHQPKAAAVRIAM